MKDLFGFFRRKLPPAFSPIQYWEESNKSICAYLWAGLCIRSNGRFVPCCMYDEMVAAPNLKDFDNNIEQAFNSQTFREMRQKALAGVDNEGCKGCTFREKTTGKSLRRKANDEFWHNSFAGETSSLENIEYVEIFVGNLCNLRCTMCSPDLSTSLAQDYYKLGIGPKSKTVPVEHDYRELVSRLPKLRTLKFVGGEPMINKSHWELLESIPRDKASGMTLEYATNCTFYPNEKQFAVWDKFKSLEIFVSIDGFDKTTEYIRYPSKWKIVEKNARLFKEYIGQNPLSVFGVNSVISIYNIFYLDLFTEWARDNLGEMKDFYGDTTFFLSCLNYPNYLNIENLPDHYKKSLLEKYPDHEDYSFVRAVLSKKQGDPKVLNELGHQTLRFDELRQVSYMDYIPAIQPLIEASLNAQL